MLRDKMTKSDSSELQYLKVCYYSKLFLKNKTSDTWME